ncbi:MAG: site-2 protease family protein [Clostridiales Family XIII bacterium]|nr:site-2 protease family protein [Clostridiales Family XIII bacterium]
MVLTIIISIIIFGILIFIHEFGHFITAKLFKVRVNEFALGMGPKIWGIKKGDTQYSLRALPIGGYCAMEGEDAAGSGMTPTDGADDDMDVNSSATSVLSSAALSSASAASVSFQDKPYYQRAIILFAGSFMNLLFAYLIMFALVLYYMVVSGKYDIGFLFMRPIEIIGEMARFMYEFIGQLFVGKAPMDDLSGPVGIVQAVGESTKTGVSGVSFLAAIISLNLAVMNLLPFPALDGGRLVFLLINKITGNRVGAKVESMFHVVGMALLFMLMIYVTFNDVLKM